MRLKDQIAIVTGAGRNIGEDISKLFVEETSSNSFHKEGDSTFALSDILKRQKPTAVSNKTNTILRRIYMSGTIRGDGCCDTSRRRKIGRINELAIQRKKKCAKSAFIKICAYALIVWQRRKIPNAITCEASPFAKVWFTSCHISLIRLMHIGQ